MYYLNFYLLSLFRTHICLFWQNNRDGKGPPCKHGENCFYAHGEKKLIKLNPMVCRILIKIILFFFFSILKQLFVKPTTMVNNVHMEMPVILLMAKKICESPPSMDVRRIFSKCFYFSNKFSRQQKDQVFLRSSSSSTSEATWNANSSLYPDNCKTH